MAATAVEVYRGNDQPYEKDAKDKIANRQKVLDGVEGAHPKPDFTGDIGMKNETNDRLHLVSSDSRDNALPHPLPLVIPPHGRIEFKCRDTIGSGVAYRCQEHQYDWVLAWANKPDGAERVLTLLHPPRDYDKVVWEQIFALLDAQRSKKSSATFMDRKATAEIVVLPDGTYRVKATLRQTIGPPSP